MSSYLVTGTSRGLGLEIVKQLLDLPASQVTRVLAITRDTKSDQLTELIRNSGGRAANIVIGDITKEGAVKKAVPEVEALLEGKGLDVFINNAGVASYEPDGMQSVTSTQLLDNFNVNVVSVQVMTSAFLPLLRKGGLKKVINMSTTLGSIERVKYYDFAPTHAYKISKTAVNMLNAQYAMEFEKQGFTFLALTPGWVKTDLGSQHADLEADVAVRAVLDLVFTTDKSMNGQFRNVKVPGWETRDLPNRYDGAVVPW